MTPSNQPLDKEAQAIADAFRQDDKPDERSNGKSDGQNGNANAQNSNQQQNGNQTAADEGRNGKSEKVIKVVKPQSKQQQQNSDENQNQQSQQQQQSQSAIKPEDFEKQLNETFKLDSKTLSTKLKRVAELEELMAKSPYLDHRSKVFDELLSKNVSPDTALKYINTDKTKMSPKDIMALALQVDNPAMSMEKVTDYIDQTYKLGKYAENGDEAPGLNRLEFDAQKHIKAFDELKEKMLNNEDNRTSLATKQKEVERVKGWEKPIKDIFDGFTNIEVKTPGGAKLQYAIEMNAEEKAELQEEFNDMVLKNPAWIASDEGVADAQAVLRARYVSTHFDDIALAFMNQGRSISENEWINEIHNPSLPNGKGQNQQRSDTSRDDQIMSAFDKAEGGTRRT